MVKAGWIALSRQDDNIYSFIVSFVLGIFGLGPIRETQLNRHV